MAASLAQPPPVAGLRFRMYAGESDLPAMVELIEKDLSEPYSVFTYRFFLNAWPQLCELCFDEASGQLVGVVVCKMDKHKSGTFRGYIGMLAIRTEWRGRKLASALVECVIERMRDIGADECVLEAEMSNLGALALYRSLGFVRSKLLRRYYLNGSDAFRLKLQLKERPTPAPAD